MEIKGLLLQILQAVIIAAVPVITGYLCSVLKAKSAKLRQEMTDEQIKALMDEATDAIATAVTYVNQTYVDELKKSGTFSKENQTEAFRRAYKAATELMSSEAQAYINATFDDVAAWMSQKIEAEVNAQKA